MIDAILNYSFMQNAVVAAILTSIVTGIIGTIAIEKKLISMSGGIAHASFGGIGLGYLMGFEPIWGGLAFAIGSSVLISRQSDSQKISADTLTGILWSFGMALGILFISLAPGYMPDMTSYLFGDILSVSNEILIYMAVFTVCITLVFIMMYHYIVVYLLDEEFARASGINVTAVKWMIYLILPVGIIVLIKAVGVILTIALMTIPVSMAKLFYKTFGRVVLGSIIISMIFSLAGLTVSYYAGIPSGVCIIILSTAVYLVLFFTKNFVQKRIHTQLKHNINRQG
jgi:zinc transport system permease protein